MNHRSVSNLADEAQEGGVNADAKQKGAGRRRSAAGLQQELPAVVSGGAGRARVDEHSVAAAAEVEVRPLQQQRGLGGRRCGNGVDDVPLGGGGGA
jgi:hypothetical protein